MTSAGNADDLFNPFMRPRKKRGRKSKAEKEAETKAATEAAVVASYHRIVGLDVDPDVRIPMINLEVCQRAALCRYLCLLWSAMMSSLVLLLQDGSRLTGDDGPLRKDLQAWMLEHPGYMAEVPDNLGSSSSSSQGALASMASSTGGEKRSRRPKAESSELPNLSSLTGAENVPVIHRESGKRLSGSKAPTLLQLSSWLDKNPHYDIDPVWGTLATVIVHYSAAVDDP